MRKLFFTTLSIAMLAGISSCGKSTKGKMANDWKVTSYEEHTFTTQGGSGSLIMDETTMNSGTSVAALHQHDFTIRKDGTWTISRYFTYTDPDGTTKNETETSGTWGFVKKKKEEDFGKNERVIFHVLKDLRNTTATSGGQAPVLYTQENTYLAGENTMIFTVKESKNKELKLSLEENANESGDVTTRTLDMTLKKK